LKLSTGRLGELQLKILEYIYDKKSYSVYGEVCTVTEIANDFKLNQSTVYESVQSLKKKHYIKSHRESKYQVLTLTDKGFIAIFVKKNEQFINHLDSNTKKNLPASWKPSGDFYWGLKHMLEEAPYYNITAEERYKLILVLALEYAGSGENASKIAEFLNKCDIEVRESFKKQLRRQRDYLDEIIHKIN
jgi:DNA-binding MarR family transcriptional regulator